MDFQIPADISAYSAAGLADLRRIAADEYNQLFAALRAAGDSVETEQIDRAEALAAFITLADDQLAKLTADTSRVAALTEVTKVEPVTEPVVATESVEVNETVTAATTTITVTDIAPAVIETGKPAVPEKRFTILAAAETGVAAGSELADWKAVTAAFLERTRTYGHGTAAMQHPVAIIKRHFDEDFMVAATDSEERIYRVMENARDEKRLSGGSLVAGAGWCAPSETIYSTCSQVTTDGLVSLPEIGARRGGIKHNQGIDFSAIFGAGTGFNIKTEAQVISDSAKTCVAIPCPSFVDDRLKVAALCLTGDILQNVGYPEFVQAFVEGAIAAQAHNVNKDIIAAMVTGSTAVDLTAGGVEPWNSDGSVVSQVMSAVELAVVDMRYRLRLSRTATIEMIFPFWLRAQMRADWIRRNAANPADLDDAMIDAMFARRGVVAQFPYDWQDTFAGVANGPGGGTASTALPATPLQNLVFLAYPAGTWLLARQDVIRLDSVYDSTNLATNKVTQLFMEDGYLPMRMCPLSRVYTVTLCPNGSTGVQRAVDCVVI